MSLSTRLVAPPGTDLARSDEAADRQGYGSDLPAHSYFSGASGAYRFRLHDLVVTAFLRWRLILLALLFPAALGIAGAFLAPVRYTAESVLVVMTSRESSGAQDLAGFGPTVVSVEVLKVARSEIEILQSGDVIRRALMQIGPTTLFPGLSGPRRSGLGEGGAEAGMLTAAAELFSRTLRAEADTNSNVVRVRFTHPDRQLAVEALRALLEAYYERRVTMFNDNGSRLLVAELERYADQLKGLEAQIQAVRARFSVLDIGQEIQLTTARLDGITQREDRLREQQATAQAQLEAARAQLAAQPGRVFASQEATNVVPNDDSRNALQRLLQQREHVVTQYTSDYPALRELDQRIAAARQAVREGQRAAYSTTRQVRNPAVELLSNQVVTLEVQTSALQRQLEELERQRRDAEARAASLREAESQLRDLQRRRDGMEAIVRQFATREAGARV
ncbi:MAG TPA: Wzz/FepE/Etk N-terminal domain-containing protein, partial [Roseomonas sp.]